MPRNPAINPRTREQAARFYLPLYLGLGSERSIRRVWEICRDANVKISLPTLMGYSRAGGWVEEARKFDAEHAERNRGWALDQLMANDQRQVMLGRAFQQMAVDEMQKRINARGNLDPAGLSEIARIGEVGVKIERLASGQATEVRSILVNVYNVVTSEVGRLWMAAMEDAQRVYREFIEDEDVHNRAYNAAATRFGPGVDRLVSEHFSAVGIRDVVIEGEVVTDDE